MIQDKPFTMSLEVCNAEEVLLDSKLSHFWTSADPNITKTDVEPKVRRAVPKKMYLQAMTGALKIKYSRLEK